MEEADPQKTEENVDGLDRDNGYAEPAESYIIDQGQWRVVDQRIPLVGDPAVEKNLVSGVVTIYSLIKIDSGASRKRWQNSRRIGLDALRPEHGGGDQDQGENGPLFPGQGRSGSLFFHCSDYIMAAMVSGTPARKKRCPDRVLIPIPGGPDASSPRKTFSMPAGKQ